jgi:hypothetical protein
VLDIEAELVQAVDQPLGNVRIVLDQKNTDGPPREAAA